MTNQYQSIEEYLDSLRTESTETVIDTAWEVWERLRNHFLSKDLYLEIPDACPGEKDNFMYTWTKSEHYFECEVFGTGEIEFFCRNRDCNQVWGEDTTLEQGFSNTVFDKVACFADVFVSKCAIALHQ